MSISMARFPVSVVVILRLVHLVLPRKPLQ